MPKQQFTYNLNAKIYGDAGLEIRMVMRKVRVETPLGIGRTALPELQVRKDIWADWLHDAIDAAADASSAADLPTEQLVASNVPGGGPLRREMRLSMRSITAVAFTLDGLYAAVKARAGEHPDQAIWSARDRPPARYKQAFETLRYHLKLSASDASAVRALFKRSFELRDVAVHPTAKFRPPAFREDLGEMQVEWHYSVFHSKEARGLVEDALSACRVMVDHIATSDNEKLSGWHSSPNRDMSHVEAAYAASPLVDRQR